RLEPRLDVGGDLLDHAGMLGHRKGVFADGLAVPAGHPGEAVGDVLDLDVERRRIEKVQASARQHALPGAGSLRDDGSGTLGQGRIPARVGRSGDPYRRRDQGQTAAFPLAADVERYEVASVLEDP